jgi:thiamine-phosphate pyrophosphorylase
MAARCLLYYITDQSQFDGDDRKRRCALIAKIDEAARAGVDYIQLREKDLNARELELLVRHALAVVRDSALLGTEKREIKTRFLVNSRTDIALAAGADGVHLRGDDIAIPDVRQISELSLQLRPSANHFLVAKSCHSAAEVQRAESEGADFIVFAPVFEKNNSAGTRPAGIAALREACRAKSPVLALGGVTLENAPSCLDAGAAGIAGIRLFQDNKIEDVVGALRAL